MKDMEISPDETFPSMKISLMNTLAMTQSPRAPRQPITALHFPKCQSQRLQGAFPCGCGCSYWLCWQPSCTSFTPAWRPTQKARLDQDASTNSPLSLSLLFLLSPYLSLSLPPLSLPTSHYPSLSSLSPFSFFLLTSHYPSISSLLSLSSLSLPLIISLLSLSPLHFFLLSPYLSLSFSLPFSHYLSLSLSPLSFFLLSPYLSLSFSLLSSLFLSPLSPTSHYPSLSSLLHFLSPPFFSVPVLTSAHKSPKFVLLNKILKL